MENEDSPEKGYECKWDNCNETVNDDMFSHIKTHLKDQTEFKCCWSGCPKYNEVNVSKGGVYSHCRTHVPNNSRLSSAEKNWTCPICKVEFNSMSVYYRHKKKHSILEKKEEQSVSKINLLGHLLEYHKQQTKFLLQRIEEKKTSTKFINNEITEIIKKYVKGANCYENMKSWEEYI
ncbi:hypothetical protein P3W45_001264 [Vairimorpha bombi]|jgi:hypothetical protein